MKLLCSLLLGLSLAVICCAQTNQIRLESPPQPQPSIVLRQIVDLPAPNHRGYRPSLTMQAALKMAETYIAKQRIDISPYYLYSAKYFLYGSKDNQDPSWFFWWVKEGGTTGDNVYIVVSIKTKNVHRLLSM